jgi:WD40 repeat protein
MEISQLQKELITRNNLPHIDYG